MNYIELIKALNAQPPVKIKDSWTREIINCHLTLENPRDMFVTYRHRQLDYAYVAGQLAWYLRGRVAQLDGIDFYHESWKRIKRIDRIEALGIEMFDIHSNYGIYVWGEKQLSEAVIRRLTQDPSSRQALVLFNRPVVSVSSTADHICTTSLQFLIRDDELHVITTMRSNDFWNGLCYDIPFFMFLQTMVWMLLRGKCPQLRLGSYHHNVGSMHAYQENWAAMEQIEQDPVQDPHTMPILDSLNDLTAILYEFGETEEGLRKGRKTFLFQHQALHKDFSQFAVFSWLCNKIIDKFHATPTTELRT